MNKTKKLLMFPFPMIPTIVFLTIGLLKNIWHPTWLIYVTIPLYYYLVLVLTRKSKKGVVLVSSLIGILIVVYVVLGMMYMIWHPLWLVFLLIPFILWIAYVIDQK